MVQVGIDDLIHWRDVADRLPQVHGRQISDSTIFRWIRDGQLPSRKVGSMRFVAVVDIERFVAGELPFPDDMQPIT